LKSHRGWDPGAIELAKEFATKLKAPLFAAQTSRLLIELNRSLPHPSLFSEFTRDLPLVEKQLLIEDYYLPYRARIEDWIGANHRGGRAPFILHISVHTFTPKLDGEVRDADIGLLFDPGRAREAEFCRAWRERLQADYPALRVRDNYPYLGTDDGFTTWLRYRYPTDAYAGIELEVNQSWPLGNKQEWKRLQTALAETLQRVLL
jgi:predicted N-formylglutamate amidohydrolase